MLIDLGKHCLIMKKPSGRRSVGTWLTYYPLLTDFQKALNKAKIFLTPNEEHKTVFREKLLMIGWRKVTPLRIIKYIKESKSARFNRKRSQVCRYIEKTCEFGGADGNKSDIHKGVINCNTNFSVSKLNCSFCSKQNVEEI